MAFAVATCPNCSGRFRLVWRIGGRRIEPSQRLRRLWNVAEQFLLAATAQNLKRLVRFLAQRQPSPALPEQQKGKEEVVESQWKTKEPS